MLSDQGCSGGLLALVAWFLLELLFTMCMEEGAITNGIIKFDSFNYSLGKPMMEDILYLKDLYKPFVKDNIPTGVMEE